MIGLRSLVAGLAIVCVVGFFLLGLTVARETVGGVLGLAAGLASATFWALASIFAHSPARNMRLNLFAALFAAGSLGFLAPMQAICASQHFVLMCR
ncbi:MAG TPA: hypothetical protein VHW66_05130 [Stellaceae bacterium]|nr:hypothetical protein [Stellaceae bacterium]